MSHYRPCGFSWMRPAPPLGPRGGSHPGKRRLRGGLSVAMISSMPRDRMPLFRAAVLGVLILTWLYACPPPGPTMIPPVAAPGDEGGTPVPEGIEPEEETRPDSAESEPEPAGAPDDFASLHVFTVPGNVAWTDTGLDVSEGQGLVVLAEGAISLQKGNPTAVCGPDGYGLRTAQQPLPDHNYGALIGKVALFLSKRTDPQTGREIREELVEIFPLGSRGEVTAPLRGRLFLGVNELVVGDNEGAFRVRLYLLR